MYRTEKLTTYQAHKNVKHAYIIWFLHPTNTAVETGTIQWILLLHFYHNLLCVKYIGVYTAWWPQ